MNTSRRTLLQTATAAPFLAPPASPPRPGLNRRGAVAKITSIEKPDPGATIMSGAAKIGTRSLQWFYWPRNWLHVREQDRRNPHCWMNIETPEGFREEVLKAVRRAKRIPGKAGK
jgi:hypothetical protein